jgi:hypothetical protein
MAATYPPGPPPMMTTSAGMFEAMDFGAEARLVSLKNVAAG